MKKRKETWRYKVSVRRRRYAKLQEYKGEVEFRPDEKGYTRWNECCTVAWLLTRWKNIITAS